MFSSLLRVQPGASADLLLQTQARGDPAAFWRELDADGIHPQSICNSKGRAPSTERIDHGGNIPKVAQERKAEHTGIQPDGPWPDHFATVEDVWRRKAISLVRRSVAEADDMRQGWSSDRSRPRRAGQRILVPQLLAARPLGCLVAQRSLVYPIFHLPLLCAHPDVRLIKDCKLACWDSVQNHRCCVNKPSLVSLQFLPFAHLRKL
mmetsp:Transcript_368/g.798  ORF Transcript_368/g.798 Transcript_368/m.798 type:complete len:206 (+) Transcript_368:352-969(+)